MQTDARTAVSALSKLSSPIETFVAAYARIVDAGTTLVEADRNALLTVVSNFVDNKIPTNDINFQPLEDSARLFQQNLAAQIIGMGMANIAERNVELQSLIAQFGVQIAATNDGPKLQQITAQITKATAAVNEIRDLVTQLSTPNASASARIQAVLTALQTLEQTF